MLETYRGGLTAGTLLTVSSLSTSFIQQQQNQTLLIPNNTEGLKTFIVEDKNVDINKVFSFDTTGEVTVTGKCTVIFTSIEVSQGTYGKYCELKSVDSISVTGTGTINKTIIGNVVNHWSSDESTDVDFPLTTLTSATAFTEANGSFGSLQIGSNVTSIASYCFLGDTGFFGDLIFEGGTNDLNINKCAFEACDNFNGTLVLSDNIKLIGGFAFDACQFCGQLTLPNSAWTISSNAFNGNLFNSLEFQATQFTSLAKYAFTGLDKLKTITFNFGESEVVNWLTNANTVTADSEWIDSTTAANLKAMYIRNDNSLTAFVYLWNNTVTGPFMSPLSSSKFQTKPAANNSVDASLWISGATGTIYYTIDENNNATIVSSDGVVDSGNYTSLSVTAESTIQMPSQIGGYDIVAIGEGAFSKGTNRTQDLNCLLDLSQMTALSDIGTSAFQDTDITSVKLPTQLSILEGSAFQGCSSLLSFDFNNNATMTSLSANIFSGCTKLENVSLPTGISNLPNSLFSNCKDLVSIDFGTNTQINSIGDEVFEGCTSLESFNLPNSIISLGTSCFQNCTQLKNIDFGTNNTALSTLGVKAFYNCSALTSLNLPDSVTIIGNNAFENCAAITSLHLSSNIETIGTNAFNGLRSLNNITFTPKENSNYGILSTDNGQAIICDTNSNGDLNTWTNSTVCVTGLACGDIDLTDSTATTIAANAFNNTNVKSVIFPASVTKINSYALANTPHLTTITFLTESSPTWMKVTATTGIDSTWLSGNVQQISLNVPESQKDNYDIAFISGTIDWYNTYTASGGAVIVNSDTPTPPSGGSTDLTLVLGLSIGLGAPLLVFMISTLVLATKKKSKK